MEKQSDRPMTYQLVGHSSVMQVNSWTNVREILGTWTGVHLVEEVGEEMVALLDKTRTRS